jgi:hypothetical protein
MDPLIIVAPTLVILLGVILTSNSYSALEYLMLVFFIIIITVMGFNYFFGIQLTATLNDLFNAPKVNVDIVEPTENGENNGENGVKESGYPQTYHVKGQFDYKTARSVCKAYGAKLATLDQVKEAHHKGGEWCGYGWSEDQMVLYPTQKSSWDKYQETDHKEQCGIPGINGGYNVRDNQKLGVNCFGKKPDGVVPELAVEPTKVDQQAAYWQQNLTISPFNYTSWSEF